MWDEASHSTLLFKLHVLAKPNPVPYFRLSQRQLPPLGRRSIQPSTAFSSSTPLCSPAQYHQPNHTRFALILQCHTCRAQDVTKVLAAKFNYLGFVLVTQNIYSKLDLSTQTLFKYQSIELYFSNVGQGITILLHLYHSFLLLHNLIPSCTIEGGFFRIIEVYNILVVCLSIQVAFQHL